jgi:hypothetical protein
MIGVQAAGWGEIVLRWRGTNIDDFRTLSIIQSSIRSEAYSIDRRLESTRVLVPYVLGYFVINIEKSFIRLGI